MLNVGIVFVVITGRLSLGESPAERSRSIEPRYVHVDDRIETKSTV